MERERINLDLLLRRYRDGDLTEAEVGSLIAEYAHEVELSRLRTLLDDEESLRPRVLHLLLAVARGTNFISSSGVGIIVPTPAARDAACDLHRALTSASNTPTAPVAPVAPTPEYPLHVLTRDNAILRFVGLENAKSQNRVREWGNTVEDPEIVAGCTSRESVLAALRLLGVEQVQDFTSGGSWSNPLVDVSELRP